MKHVRACAEVPFGTFTLAAALALVGNVANTPSSEKDFIMKLGKLTVLSAAALLAGGLSIASAQSSMQPSGSSGAAANQGKCWDSASNQIKDKAQNKNESASGQKAPGGVATGSNPSGVASQTTGSAAQRPAAAAGLPNC